MDRPRPHMAAVVTLFSIIGFLTGCGSHSSQRAGAKPREVHGLSAAGLSQGSLQAGRFAVHRGQLFTIAMVELKNAGGTPAIIHGVEAVTRPRNLAATRVHVYVFARGDPELPITAFGWPPKGFKFIAKLPVRNAVLPAGSYVEFPFAVQSFAEPGSTVHLSALRIHFSQGGKTYNWTIPSPIAMPIRRALK
jgi:hypothetical protein